MQQHNINNTQRIITAMELNQIFPINSISIHGNSSQILCLLSSCFWMLMLLQISSNPSNNTKEGAYIPFSLSKAKLSNLDLINLSTCIKSNKCLSYLRTRAYLLKIRLTIQVHFIKPCINVLEQQYHNVSKFVLALPSCILCSTRWLAWWGVDAPASLSLDLLL